MTYAIETLQLRFNLVSDPEPDYNRYQDKFSAIRQAQIETVHNNVINYTLAHDKRDAEFVKVTQDDIRREKAGKLFDSVYETQLKLLIPAMIKEADKNISSNDITTLQRQKRQTDFLLHLIADGLNDVIIQPIVTSFNRNI